MINELVFGTKFLQMSEVEDMRLSDIERIYNQACEYLKSKA